MPKEAYTRVKRASDRGQERTILVAEESYKREKGTEIETETETETESETETETETETRLVLTHYYLTFFFLVAVTRGDMGMYGCVFMFALV